MHECKGATPAQLAVRQCFQQAVIHGKAVVNNSNSKALYETQAKEGETAFNVAVADFFNAQTLVR